MIANPERTVVVSSVGWVDHDVLWRFDVPTADAARIPLGSGARHLSLHSSGSSHFAVAHHFDGERFFRAVDPWLSAELNQRLQDAWPLMLVYEARGAGAHGSQIGADDAKHRVGKLTR